MSLHRTPWALLAFFSLTIASSLALTREAHSGCPLTGVLSSKIVDERIDERCDNNIIISWNTEGTYLGTNFKINISPPTEDDVSEIIEEGYDLYDPVPCRFGLTIANVKEGVPYDITINLLGEDDETLDDALLSSEDLCQAESCEDGWKCCDDGDVPTCHCTEESQCEDGNPCDSNPCQNGGLCVRQHPGYVCSCPVGYGGTHCERLVLVEVKVITYEPHCTSVLIMWEARNVGLEPERYEVWGAKLGTSENQLLCESEHPMTQCLAKDLVRAATYLFEIVSIHGQESVKSNVETFTLKDHPSFATCPSDTEPAWADGVNEIPIWWEEPETECVSETTIDAQTNSPGDLFPIGTTTVMYGLVDGATVLDNCTFDVEVKERGVCTAYGDPHYMSFNNDHYSFQGVCTYILAATSQSVSPRFNVTVKNNESESNPEFSITKEVNVTIYDKVISLMEDGEVRIDGIRVRLPARPVSDVFVVRNGMLVSLHTDFGFYVSFDGKHQVVVKAPADPYKYQVGGLCDHYHGEDRSMYVMPGGAETEDVNEFGHSWAIEQCEERSESPCTPADENHKCDIIIDDPGPFKGCHVIGEHDEYYDSCLTDYCAIGDYCSAIEAYQRRCRDLGLPVEEWRDEDTCPKTIECEEGKEYDFCGSPCMNTCVEPDASENCPITDCMEGCFCPDGTVLDDDKCVDPADCGCIWNGTYFSIGDIYITPGCTTECICTESKEMVCEEMECDENASCLIRDGIRECVCNEPYYEGDGLVCTRKCDEPESPENGGKNEDHDYPVSSGEEVTFYCNPDFMLYDPVTQSCLDDARTECDNGNWTNPVPECKLGCTDPGTPGDGRQVGDIVYPVCTGTEVAFECDTGYELIGAPSTTCEEGYWSDPVPLCQAMCNEPGDVENGNPVDEPSYPVSEGTEIEYECDAGYSLYDPELRVCLDEYTIVCKDGDWSDLPTCQIMCDDPGQVDNGGLVNVPLFPVCEGTVLEYECDPMHELTGSERLVCENGEWSDKVPKCIIMCGDPGPVQYDGECDYPEYPTSNGTVVDFCCDEGYDLIDPSDGSCLETYHSVCIDGEWSHDNPSCEAQCYDPGTPSDGSQIGPVEYPVCSGTCVPFTCDEGHELHGEEIICCDDGDWTSPKPSCHATCEDPGHPNHGRQVGDHDYPVSEGYIVEFECDDPYILFDNETKVCIESASVTCDNGTWGDLPLCKRSCDDPGPLSDGSVTQYEYPVCSGTIVEFECDEGFELIGSDKTICNDNTWYPDIPHCAALCDDPGTPDNGYQNEGHEYPVIEDTKVTYGCLDGYNLHDPDTNECLEAYETVCEGPDWTKPYPLCLAECKEPETPPNGSPVEDHTYPVCSGTTVSFECDEDHFLSGEDTLTCEEGGWNPDVPTCLPGCHDPGTPEDGSQLDDHTYPVPPGTTVRFCCDENFLLIGNQVLLCLENGTWDGVHPTCEPMCEDPGVPENGFQVDVVEYPVPSGTKIHYDCNLGFEKHGKGFSKCENGTWIPPVDDTYCVEIDECCSDPCKNGGRCIDGIGRFDCLCPPGFDGFNCGQEYGVCYVWGDPHYMTYDGEKYDFNGDCMYILTESATAEKTSFRVVVNNEAFDVGEERLSVTQELAVIVYGQEIRLMRDGKVLVDGSYVAVPYYASSGIQVKQSGRYTNIYVDIGLVVRWDGHHYGDVKIPEDYKGIVRGLCGNFNGDPADDFMDPEYRLIPPEMEHTHRAAMFGNTWIANPEECVSDARGCNPCAADVDMAMQAHELCSLLTDPDGPFAECHETVNPEDYFGACMFDLCAKLPDEEGLCMNAETYAQACLDNFIPINWRSEVLCPITCSADKVYNASVPSCTSSCSVQIQYYECPERRLVDGCVCPEGEVLGTDEYCVPVEQCPCEYQGEIMEVGDVVISENCYEKCSCLQNGRVDCISIRCDPNAFCGEKEGEYGCHCNAGFNGDGMRCSAILCDANPCANGGICTEHSNYYTCTCPQGFQGVRCETAINGCENNPCHHGGMCVTDDDDGYQCLCVDGYSGDNCERTDCLVDGVYSSDGSSWYDNSGDGCQLCSCNNGANECKELTASTYYNDHLICQDDSDCGEYGPCEPAKVACVGDDCVKLCTGVAIQQHPNQDTCYDHLSGDYNKCIVLDVEFMEDPLSICQDLSHYIRNNVPSISECVDIDCIDRNVLNKRRDVRKKLRVVIERENDVKSETSEAIVKELKEVIEKDRSEGTLKDSLTGISIVDASSDSAHDSSVSSWLLPTLMAVVAAAVVCIIGVVLYRRQRGHRREQHLIVDVSDESYGLGTYRDEGINGFSNENYNCEPSRPVD